MAGHPAHSLFMCCAVSQSERAICEKSGRDSPIAITIATSITARTPSWLSKIQGRRTFRVIGDPSRFAETKRDLLKQKSFVECFKRSGVNTCGGGIAHICKQEARVIK